MQPTAYKRYLLILLMVILAFNFVDRLTLGIVLQDIKTEFALSDTQLGLLNGIAFALFYAVMGIPLARWADRGNRVTIISLTAALWSAMVVLCGTAMSFIQLMLIRVGVAVGEAGCIPPAHSLIADHFSRAERPKAASIYALGGPLAFVIGYFLAGWLNELYGWRATFIILGAPGLVLAAVAWLTLREPRLVGSVPAETFGIEPKSAARAATQPALKEVWATLWGNATFRQLLLSFAAIHYFGYGTVQWQPTFFVRSFGLQTGEVGTWFAVIYGLAGGVGTYVGGAWASRHFANNERAQLRAMAIATTIYALLSIFLYLAFNQYLAFALLTVACLALYSIYGPFFATIQTLVPERMRATAIALIYLFANFIGMGLGPLTTGALSDAFHPWSGDDSLRYALLTLSPGFCCAAWFFWRASRTVARDVPAVNAAGTSAIA